MNQLKSSRQGRIFFTDEKLFTVEATHNRQNDRILGRKSKEIPLEGKAIYKCPKPASVMVWASAMSDRKKSPLKIFVKEDVKMNQETYLDMLADEILPWICEHYSGLPFTFQQDGVPAHTAKMVQMFCEVNFLDFWDKLMWPPSSPDLNVTDFSI